MTSRMSRMSRMSRIKRTGAHGFTLVELMVSLVAGLIITIAVVGLARTATTTFYEEARLSAVEGTVRSASERLRQDLSRVSYMSTGNLHLAGSDTTPPAGLAVPYGQRISHVSGTSPSRYGATTDSLQGIKIRPGNSKAATDGAPNALATLNGLNPDEIVLTGNFTTDDAYRGKMVANTIVVTVADDPAVARLIAGPNPDLAVRNAFAPGSPPAGAIYPALARVVDIRGCSHFVVLATVAGTATNATFTFAAVTATDGFPPILTPGQDGGGCGADPQEEVMINPVQIVHWYIGPTSVALRPDPLVDDYRNKFDLYREFRDANDGLIASPGGPQVVAEYAVDLKFGITVDDGDTALTPPANRRIFDMDKATDVPNITNWTKPSALSTSGQPGPQRVRSVRYRLATRAALPDRTAPLPVPPGAPYLARYCTNATCTHAARVRTIMSEVPLINQARMTY
jgi:type II secretory pathway pseudopilin PulG